MTNAEQLLQCARQAGEISPAPLDDAGLAAVQNGSHFQHESGGIVLQFGDLRSEENPVALLKSLFSWCRTAPALTPIPRRKLETRLMMLPSRTVNELVSTFGERAKSYGKRASLLLEGMKNGNVSEYGRGSKPLSLQDEERLSMPGRACLFVDDPYCHSEGGLGPCPCQGHKVDHCAKVLEWNL